MLLGGGGDETPDAVRLPICGAHDLGEGRALGPSDHFDDLRALALGARRAGVLRAGGLGGLFAGLGFLFRRGGLGFGALGGFLALGRALLLAGALLRGGLLWLDVRALFRNGGGLGGVSGCVVLHWS